MKNQYFGDVNDYLKYGLLRCFTDVGWRIGVCWMLTPDDGRPDGNKRHYLSEAGRWRHYDPPLFDFLSAVPTARPRRISIVEGGSVIPQARFFSDPVPDDRTARSAWLGKALNQLSSADLLFFDPDNGLEVPHKPIGRKDCNKYLYWNEVRLSWDQGASLLIFQHFPRKERQAYITSLAARLQQEAPKAVVTPLRSPNVLFLLACQPQHGSIAATALELVRLRWKGKINL